jgi:hypothetical protein
MLIPDTVQLPADRLVSVHRQAALARRGFDASAPITAIIVALAWPSRDKEPDAFCVTPAGTVFPEARQ